MAGNKKNILNGNRTLAFWLISFVLIGGIVLIDVFDIFDPCLLIYVSIALIAFTCTVFFADWWRVKGSASSIFKWITVLLLALAYVDSVNFVARYLHQYNPCAFDAFMGSVWWSYRSVPKLLAVIYLLTFAIWQRFGRNSTYHDGLRQDMSNGFSALDAKIVAGEIRFEGHSHEGLVLGAKLILAKAFVDEIKNEIKEAQDAK